MVTTSILTVGDAADNGYRLVGVPDGLGAFDNGDGTFTLLVNRELPPAAGVVRDHGFVGAFVSRWTMDIETLQVLAGEDLAKRFYAPNATGGWSPLTAAQPAMLGGPAGAKRVLRRRQRSGHDATPLPQRRGGGLGRAFAHVIDGANAGSSTG